MMSKPDKPLRVGFYVLVKPKNKSLAKSLAKSSGRSQGELIDDLLEAEDKAAKNRSK